jgi:hypothetical protein
MATLPEEAEGLPLHLFEQLIIGQVGKLGRPGYACAPGGTCGSGSGGLGHVGHPVFYRFILLHAAEWH